MNLDSLSASLIHICNLVKKLNKKNLNQTTQELSEYIFFEADCQLIHCLLAEIVKATSDIEWLGSAGNTEAHAALLAFQTASLLNHPARVSVLCSPFDESSALLNKLSKPSGGNVIGKVSKLFKLSAAQDVALCLVLRYSSKQEIVDTAQQYLKKKFVELVYGYLDSESAHQTQGSGLQDCSPEVLQSLLIALSTENFGVAPVTKELFLKRLRRDFPREVVPIVLAPLLYPDDTETPLEEMTSVEEMTSAMMDNSLADLVREFGYGFTASIEHCKTAMMNFGAREPSAIDIARTISMMVRHNAGLPEGPTLQTPGNFWIGHEGQKESHNDTWNGEVFAQTLDEMSSNLNWKEIILHLDHPEFSVPDRQGLALLFTILRCGLKNAGYPTTFFPLEYLCRRWTNIDGQMSLITNILKNPDIFSLADHPFHPVAIDILKALPETENKEIATWRCLYLIEALLYACERGYYVQVQEILNFPMQHCPDVLLLGLLQIAPPVTLVRQELITKLIPIFLGNHPNSAIILHHAWHCQNPNVKPVIMHAMADWYIRSECDQFRLTRILDVAQDLKALSLLLSVRSFPFIIDLACLASRREYLKLDKWLTDKIRDHGETFVSAMVKFLQRRFPSMIPGKITEEQLPKAAQLPPETIATMLNCLHVCIPSVQPDLSDAILSVISNCTMVINKSRQPSTMAGIIRPQRAMETSFNPAGLGAQLFARSSMDSVNSLTPNIANLNIGAPNNTTFAIPGVIGPLMATPGSPSRMMAAGPNSPFAMMPLQHSSNVVNMGTLSAARLGLNPAEKPRIPDNTILAPEMMPVVSKEVEDEANGYFQRIYTHLHPTLSVEEVLDMLKKFQDSTNKRERDVFHCMLRNLFEEYRFFPQYPDKELMITAQIFGGIIEQGLIASYMSLGIALRFVLDALRKPQGSKMYYFGVAALDRFKTRLKEYHTYCEHVKAIPHFGEFPPHLIEYVEYGLQSLEPPTKPCGPVLPASLAAILSHNPAPLRTAVCTPGPITVLSKLSTVTSAGGLGSRPSVANATNIDTLLTATDRKDKITIPPESIQDKIAFIFNNLSQLNVQTKCEELNDLITEEYFPWLSQYLVLKRASIELNFHALYSLFLDVLRIPEINRMVTAETFRNIKVLLRSDKGLANFSDRSLLKNFGHWLGMLTLAKNRPILQIDIDLKGLILEAYHKGQQELLYVVPFVAKVLESSAKSSVFKPPNSWTMGIMNVLAELHQEPELKLNLKFEIEVLCKNLSLDIANLTPAVYLKNPDKLKQIEFQLSQQTKPDIPPVPQPAHMPEIAPLSTAMAPLSTAMVPVEEASTSSLVQAEPRFNFIDLNVNSTSTFVQNIIINPQIILFQNFPHLKQFVKPAIERSIQEWVHPVVDRSIKYALTTCEQIVRKDFALDPDEMRMRTSAHNMMRNLTAGMAMITCREQLVSTISTNLKGAFLPALIPASSQQKEVVECAAAVLASDNMELACAFIQKTAVEKALPELDKRLASDFEARKLARLEGRCHYDQVALAYQTDRMPDRLRLQIGGVSGMSLYEEFTRNIPGFTPIREASITPETRLTSAQSSYGWTVLNQLINATETFMANALCFTSLAAQAGNMHSLLKYLIHFRRNRDLMSAYTLLQKAVEGLFDGYSLASCAASDREALIRYRDIHVRVLKSLQDTKELGHVCTTNQVTRLVSECREDLRYNLDAVDALIRANLINMPQYDPALAQMTDNGNNFMAVTFCMQLVRTYLIEDRHNLYVNESDLYHTLEMLVRIASLSRQPAPEGLTSLLDALRLQQEPKSVMTERVPLEPVANIHSGILQARDYEDPPGLSEKTELLLREWMSMIYTSVNVEMSKHFSVFMHRLTTTGILKNDDTITRFFRIAIQMCIENVYSSVNEEMLSPPSVTIVRAKYYNMCDAFVKLVCMLITNAGDSTNTFPKLNLLNKVLGIIAGCLLQDHEEHGAAFQQLPYHRLLMILLLDLNQPEPVLEAINYQVLTAFCHTLRIVKPSVAPAFSYAWLQLVAHRSFISGVLAVTSQQKGWSMYSTLLIDLFQYLEPFLRNTELAKPVRALYKGTLRVLLVLLHDFPEFLCDYHYAFCDEIPPNCIQMRNLILSAFPRNMRLPDPFTPNLKVDMLPEICLPPRALVDYASAIQPPQLKEDLDKYLRARAPVTFLSELRSTMQISNEPGRRYNTRLMNAVVLYVGTQAIEHIGSKDQTPSTATIAHSAHMDILQNFAVDLDFEGRYLFLNAIANQLRFPNSHTHYFSCALLYLFAEANTEAIQEQITRMLLERLIVNRPHPWGLLITFVELIKNPIYKFWDHDFVHCAPEIENFSDAIVKNKINDFADPYKFDFF